MFKKILLVLVLIIAGFAIYVAMQPPEFSVTRSAVMAAPPGRVFEQVNDFHKWDDWSPWAKLDKNAKNTFEGPSEGKGAKFAWAGNNEVGEGKMEIIESKPSELIRIKLDFIKPMESNADTDFKFDPEGDKTKVTWTMSGKNNFVGRVMCMIFNMDKTVGAQFEKGLANIKGIVEAPEKQADTPNDTPKADTPKEK